jgi:hypothetical protein
VILAAAVACAPAGHGFEQDCTRCHDPELRRQWGCDEPTAEPVVFLDPCPWCEAKRDDCEHCGGSGKAPVHRCPHALVTRDELELVQACALVEQGHLPERGGWQDQPAAFVQAYPLVMREVQHWRRVAQEKAMREAQHKR